MYFTSQNYALLAPYYDEDHGSKRQQRLAALPPALCQLGQALVGGRRSGETIDFEQQQRREQQALEDLAVLSQADRQRLFAALAPSIADELEAAWQVFDHLPYPSGYSRRPFRLKVPQDTVDANRARCIWVQRLLYVTQGFDQPVTWFAAHGAYLTWGSVDLLGLLLAGAIERGGPTGQAVFDILAATACGDHPTAKMGRHVVRGLLCASRPQGWDLIERLLLAAQREEGLRQVIMEAADEAHPEVFKRLLHVVIDQNLVRFSSIVRAAAVWVGLPFESATPKVVLSVLARLHQFLDEPKALKAVLDITASGDAPSYAPEDVFLALWSLAYQDALAAVEAAQPILRHPQVEYRFVAVYFLSQVQLIESEQALLPLIDDEDLRVAVYAYAGATARGTQASWFAAGDLFERLERLIQRLPERTKTFKPIVWDWLTLQVDRKALAGALVDLLGQRSPVRLLPYLKSMESYARLGAAKIFQQHIDEDPRCRQALLDLASDRDSSTHERIFALLDKVQPREDEIPQLEALLTRKTSSLRRGVMSLLLRQPDAALLATIHRLLNQKDDQQRLGGVELLREMALSERARAECQAIVNRLQSAGLSEVEKFVLADLLTDRAPAYTLKDALGLANLDHLGQPLEPRSKNALFGLIKKIRLGSPAAAACILALDELADQHRTKPVQVTDYRAETHTELLGSVRWNMPGPDLERSMGENRQRFQLAEVWERWWQARPKAQRDEDGLDLLRARAALSLLSGERSPSGDWIQVVPKELRTYLDEPYDFHLKYEGVIRYVLDWLIFLHPVPGAADFLLEAVEEICSRLGQHPGDWGADPWGNRRTLGLQQGGYIHLVRHHRQLCPSAWTLDQHARFWGLLVWLERFAWRNGGYYRPSLEDLLLAERAGKASADDLFFYFLGERDSEALKPNQGNAYCYVSQRFGEIRVYSGKRLHPLLAKFPVLRQVIERCRERILQVELRRGDLPTPASAPALALRSVPGTTWLVQLLSALGKTEFDRSSYSFDQNRSNVFSHLIRASYPLESDTPDVFAELVRLARIPERRLVELAVYAPQWANFVAYTLNWPGLAEGVWWVYAHTKDRQWSVDQEIHDSWAAQISEYTPLSAGALMDGAVDVVWFHRMYALVGEGHWQEIYQAARYAASGIGHARARLFADAMLGKCSAAELMERIKAKRYQDAVRALGLVPLPEDEAERQAEMLDRYIVMQAFLHTSKQFGSQRQASEKLAAAIGMENLARTAGFPDPQRLEWAMELAAVTDLAAGPVTVQAEGVTVTLSINDLGEAEIAVRKGEKHLKSLPASAKKNEAINALLARRAALEQQARRMRAALETAMVRGDEFSAGEIQALFAHPILRVMLEQLIFTGPAGMGYPVDAGRALEGLGGSIPLSADDRLRLAHPYDLLDSGCWHDWQHQCFVAERIQPFKQVFRELYLMTQTERDDGVQSGAHFSRRYAGQQVNPRQALALFGTRGWVAAPGEGVFKTFHAEGIVARVGFLQAFYTPAEVEGLTIEAVGFTQRGEWLPIPLEQIPPRLFSEVMRDMDLVVSVAHAGGVDPEASASTVEARAALVQETCALLKLANVRLENRHALVDGKLGHYTIHLSSGTVHKQPGGALCIIPVHSQQRGRLFLPFVDHDPKTAEILSKVLLLAKDQEIRDPTILEQILK